MVEKKKPDLNPFNEISDDGIP